MDPRTCVNRLSLSGRKMSLTREQFEHVSRRLRESPNIYSVVGSLPIVFFGNLCTAQIATVGLNPSDHEYLDARGLELDGRNRRFETIRSLGITARKELTDEQCDRALERMQSYFQQGKPIYSWFRSLDRLSQGAGYSYQHGEVVHLDLVQEATEPTWSKLRKVDSTQWERLRNDDLPFLKWLVGAFAIRALICNGSTPFDEVSAFWKAPILKSGRFKSVFWSVTKSHLNEERVVGIAGWDKPLARAGLRRDEETELGRILRRELEGAGIELP
jgi:hypothetical protein